MRDRSQELSQIFDSFRLRKAPSASGEGTVLVTSHTVPRTLDGLALTAEVATFNQYAKIFSQEIVNTSDSIANLTKLMKNKNAFDDCSEDIGSLSAAIKGKLEVLRNDLEALSQLKDAAQPSSTSWFTVQQKEEAALHADTIVSTLRSRLVRTGQDFKTVLQRRTKNLTDDAGRRGNLLSDTPRSAESAMFAGGLQQQQMTNSNSYYYQSRYDAVRDIEIAVGEVSELFSDFTTLMHEQQDAIVRIDEDVDQAVLNVNAGTNELLKYLGALSSNRGLILKIFMVLFVFLLFFGFVVVR
eukprot:Tbor_TRINITY_DN5561_c1_g2::TRINITY_DN5561_c1_g2_i1::g.13079::m.13079/K08490/STX5; syntaxin 5